MRPADFRGRGRENEPKFGDGGGLVAGGQPVHPLRRHLRPGFSGAAKPDLAIPLYERFMDQCRERGFTVEHGEFGADMQVFSQNDGPVTILLEL